MKMGFAMRRYVSRRVFCGIRAPPFFLSIADLNLPSPPQDDVSASTTATEESGSDLEVTRPTTGTPPGIQAPLNSYRGWGRGRGRGGRGYNAYDNYGYSGGRGGSYNSYYPQRGRGRGPPPAPAYPGNSRVLVVPRGPATAAPAYTPAAVDDDDAPPPGFASRAPPAAVGLHALDDDDGPPPGFEDDGPPPGFEDAPPGFEHVRPGVYHRGRGGRGRGAGRRGGVNSSGGRGGGSTKTVEVVTIPRPGAPQQPNNHQNNHHQQPQLALLVDSSSEALRQLALGGVPTLQVLPSSGAAAAAPQQLPAVSMGQHAIGTTAGVGLGSYGGTAAAGPGAFGPPPLPQPQTGLTYASSPSSLFSSGGGTPGTAAAFPKSIW